MVIKTLAHLLKMEIAVQVIPLMVNLPTLEIQLRIVLMIAIQLIIREVAHLGITHLGIAQLKGATQVKVIVVQVEAAVTVQVGVVVVAQEEEVPEVEAEVALEVVVKVVDADFIITITLNQKIN